VAERNQNYDLLIDVRDSRGRT